MTPPLKTEFLTLCDYATTSQEGKLSIIGIFDRMFVSQTPTTFARFFIVAILNGQPESEHNLKIGIVDPTGKDVMPPKELKIKLGTQGKSNIITDVVNLPLKSAGEHTIEIKSGGRTVGSIVFNVMKVGTSGGQTYKLPN